MKQLLEELAELVEAANGLMKYTGPTWDVQRAARELQRFDFIASFVARMTRRKAGRATVNGMQVKRVKGKWVYGFPPELWNPPARDAAALYDTIRRSPLNYYVRQAEDLRDELLSEGHLVEARIRLNKTEQKIMKQLLNPARGYYTAEAWSYNGPRSAHGTRGGSRDYNACKSLVDKGLAVLRSADGYRVPREPGYMAHVQSIAIELAPGAKELLGEASQIGLDFAARTSKRKPAKPRRTRGKGGLDPDTIVKILDVVDTREYEEIDDRWVPIKGSGTESWCARCGRPHEVHATVELADKRTAVVGTSCMKGSSLEREAKAGASAAKTIAKWERELAVKREQAKKYATIKAQVDKMRPPPVEVKPSGGKYGTNWKVVCGDAYVYSRQRTPEDALKDGKFGVEREWRRGRMNERGATLKMAAAKEWVDVLERKLKAKKKALEALLAKRA